MPSAALLSHSKQTLLGFSEPCAMLRAAVSAPGPLPVLHLYSQAKFLFMGVLGGQIIPFLAEFLCDRTSRD